MTTPSRTSPVIRILGAVTVDTGAGPVPVPARLDRSVLVHLVLAEGRALSVELLIDALWGQCPPRHARNALQVKISRLRALLGDLAPALAFSQGTYRLDVAEQLVDARVFSRALRSAAEARRDGGPTGAPETVTAVLEDALALWGGDPLAELDDHPRLVAARLRLTDEWAQVNELIAETRVESGQVGADVVSRLRQVLEHDPLRPRARLLLMRALDAIGRRAEALAVYDAGRRQLAEETGLAPVAELQDAFERLLEAERVASQRLTDVAIAGSVPQGALETARWLVAEGETEAALNLALRGAWWWWFGGRRTAGRDLFESMLDSEAQTRLNSRQIHRASAWHAVFEAVEAAAGPAIVAGEQALTALKVDGWTRDEALAGALLAERLLQRGAHARARVLLDASKHHFVVDQDEWAIALTEIIEAKAALMAGDVTTAGRRAGLLLRAFDELGDPAGQIMALDLAGYCAEIHGDLAASIRIHRRALELARRTSAPEWEAAQLTRLGSVLALSGVDEGIVLLGEAVALAEGIHSGASLALAENGLGLAAALQGDAGSAVAAHTRALTWYESQESPAGMSYTTGRLAHGLARTDLAAARTLARTATDLAGGTGDPRAIAHGLEAVACTAGEPRERARALGGARALRQATRAPLPPVLRAPLLEGERELQRELGDQLVAELRRGAAEARRMVPALGR